MPIVSVLNQFKITNLMVRIRSFIAKLELLENENYCSAIEFQKKRKNYS